MAKINPMLKNFFFSNLKRGTLKKMKEAFPEKEVGDLLKISYLLSQTKSIMRVEFEKHKGDSCMSDEEVKNLCKITSSDYDKLKSECTHVFVIMDFKQQGIFIEKKYINPNRKTENIAL